MSSGKVILGVLAGVAVGATLGIFIGTGQRFGYPPQDFGKGRGPCRRFRRQSLTTCWKTLSRSLKRLQKE